MVIRKVTVNGRPLEVSLTPEGAFRVNDREGMASIVELEPGVFSIIVGGRCYEARARNGSVYVNGARYAVEVEDPRAPRKGGPAGLEGRQTLKAAMPGKVVRLLVAEGEEVGAEQGILVVEAMKMQNEVRSPKPGRVTSIAVREGAAVSAGDVLAVVE
jgi:biotin carboxyl carrier protein